LEILKAIAETGTFTGAAKKLYITQSAVSHAVADLEKQAGTALFDRLPRGVCLTHCGETLLEEAERILAASRSLDQRIGCLEEITPVNIVSCAAIASFFLPELLSGLQKEIPSIRLRVRVVGAAETMEALKKGTADLAFLEGTEPQGAFQTLILGAYRVYAACAPDFPLERVMMTPRELCACPLLLMGPGSAARDTFDAMLSLAGQKAYPIWESVDSQALLRAAKTGLGITVLPEMLLSDAFRKKELRRLRIDGQPMENKMLAVIYKEKYRTRPIQMILDYLDRRKMESAFTGFL